MTHCNPFLLRVSASLRLCVEPIIFLVLLSLAACGGGESGAPPPPPGQISTLAYVTSSCHDREDGGDLSASQAFWIRRGEGPPVKIAEFAWGEPTIGAPYCTFYGQGRYGEGSLPAGAFQRLGVSPDGSLVIFEVTDQHSIFTHVIPEEQQGIFAIRADGTALRKLAAPSKDACFRVDWACVFGAGEPGCMAVDPWPTLEFSPGGRHIVYTDLGSSRTGEEAPQVFTLEIATGVRQQLTHLPPLPLCAGSSGDTADCVKPGVRPLSVASFLDDATVAFLRGKGYSAQDGGLFTLKADGTEEPQLVPVVALPGGGVVPVFEITSAEPYASIISVPVNGGAVVGQAFVIEPGSVTLGREPRVLQLTNYGAGQARMTTDRQRVVFLTQADPLGTNPSNQCQWFSIDRLGSGLRQLTSFSTGSEPACGCAIFNCAAPGCSVGLNGRVDQITGGLVFVSTCDPLGTNPHDGAQVFTMRPDGSGLRQLTATQGIIHEADQTITVELPGPFAVPSRLR
jgi:hypothetical protein